VVVEKETIEETPEAVNEEQPPTSLNEEYREVDTSDPTTSLAFRFKEFYYNVWINIIEYATVDKSPNNFFMESIMYLKDPTKQKTVHPKSNLRAHWNSVLHLATLIMALLFPPASAFMEDGLIFECCLFIIFIVFLVDLILNSITGYEEDNKIELAFGRIIRDYIHSLLIWDSLSFLPFVVAISAYILKSLTPGMILFSNAGLLIKLISIRLSKRHIFTPDATGFIPGFREMNSRVLRSLKLFSRVVLYCHWNTCLQFIVVKFQEYPPDSWFVRSGLSTQDPFTIYTQGAFTIVSMIITCG
jgi:hypothetical protein